METEELTAAEKHALANPLYAQVRDWLRIAAHGDEALYWKLRRQLYEALIEEEREVLFESYLDRYAEFFLNFATQYILVLKTSIPNLARHSISDEDAFICWAFFLGMMGLEATWSVLHLIRQNAMRMAFAMTRLPFEYLTRLEFYAEHKDQGRVAFASIVAQMVNRGRNYGNISAELMQEMRAHASKWKESEPESSFKTLLTFTSALTSVAPEHAKRLMNECYLTQSGVIHGSGTAMYDVLGAEIMAQTHYDPNKSVSDACLNLLCILNVLRTQFPNVYGDDDSLDQWFSEFAALVRGNIYLKSELEGPA